MTEREPARAPGAASGPAHAEEPIRIVCGLGNPGAEYAKTRHNAGFLAIDALGEELGARYWKTKPGALVAEVTHQGVRVVLVKPTSFMNVSGGPLKGVAGEYRVSPAGILVVHDDLEIAAGTVAVKMGGGHGGHNGLRSICEKLGTHDFPRVRVGIGRPPGRMAPADYVLQPMRGRDLEDFELTVGDAVMAARCAIEQGVLAAARRFSGR